MPVGIPERFMWSREHRGSIPKKESWLLCFPLLLALWNGEWESVGKKRERGEKEEKWERREKFFSKVESTTLLPSTHSLKIRPTNRWKQKLYKTLCFCCKLKRKKRKRKVFHFYVLLIRSIPKHFNMFFFHKVFSCIISPDMLFNNVGSLYLNYIWAFRGWGNPKQCLENLEVTLGDTWPSRINLVEFVAWVKPCGSTQTQQF